MKFDEYFKSIFLVNLDSRPDRLKITLEEELPKLRIQSISRMSGMVFTGIENKWIRGAVGCLMSHVACLYNALNNGTHAFMFEDDVSIIDNPYLPAIIDSALDELDTLNWQLFYLGGNLLKPCYQTTKYLAKLNHCQSTVAWACNKSFIEELLTYIPTDRFERPIDVILSDVVTPKFNSYITIPMICGQRKGLSDIEGGIVDYESYLWKRYDEALVRLPLTK